MGIYKTIAQKSIAVILVLFYMNSLFLLFSPEVFTNFQTLIPIAVLSVVVCFDVTIRSISAQRDRYNRAILGLAFLLFPFMVTLPYFEWLYFSLLYGQGFLIIMSPIGITILLLGSIILIASRIQIGQYGGAKITIEGNHQLITNGMYKHIRNPQYLGFLLMFIGYSISFGSLIVTLVTLTGLFIIFRSRMMLEEQLLLETFGDEYVKYMKQTWRLIPRVY